ncbi:MAG: hypothetical protein AAF806_32755 [Bacteroidota bacterium]
MLKEKSFNSCTLDFLDEQFGLEQVTETLPQLDKWLEASKTESISERQKEQLQSLQDLLQFNVDSWNEQELDMHFIGPLFNMINFSSTKFNLFAQRTVSGIVKDWKLFGAPDGLIASGRRVPKIPFFAFAEYKRQINPKGHPAAQALSAMLVGQSFNENANTPIYGSYVIGQDWYFMTLEGNQYSRTHDYSAITSDIDDIFRILLSLKKIIQKRTEQIAS